MTVAVLVLSVALTAAAPAGAATFTVTKTADTLDGTCDADCSLREAVTAANLDVVEDVVVLPAGTLRLELAAAPEDANADGDLDVTQDLVIRGAGAAVTEVRSVLPAATPDRVLQLVGAGIDLTLSDLVVSGGVGDSFGGGIRSDDNGTLALERVVVRENRAQGPGAFGHGGGIYKAVGGLTVRDSAIYGNVGAAPGYGGGIMLNGPDARASLTNVTIAHNRVGAAGGAIELNSTIPVELVHVTVVGNEALAQDGGLSGAGFRLRSSIVAGNTAPINNNCSTGAFVPVSEGGNVGDPYCGFSPPRDVGTLDPEVGLLAGAPIPVMEPLAGSSGLDRAVGTCPATDARGVARPQGLACDAGAAERVVPAAPDATRPALSAVSMSNKRFRVSRNSTPVVASAQRRAPRGTTFRFTLSEAAKVSLRIERARPGRRTGGSCRRPIRRLRSRPRCTRYVKAGRTLTRDGAFGANRLAFSGRIGRKALKPGTYRALLGAADQAGNKAATRRLKFRVVRR